MSTDRLNVAISYADACRRNPSNLEREVIIPLADSAVALTAENARLRAACQMAHEHVTELQNAWMRGAIRENDGKGGTRSNRNTDVEVNLRRAITLE